MQTMCDGSERIPDGAYVRVEKRRVGDGSYIAKVVGTDLGRTKYEVGVRLGGWGEWLFADGGRWAFLGEVTEISEEEALAEPEEQP